MNRAVLSILAALVSSLVTADTSARGQGTPMPPPQPVLSVVTTELPKTPGLAVAVYNPMLPPGGMTPWHTHPAPVFAYVVEGAFILEIEGKPAVEVQAGQAIMEPANTVIRAKNASTTAPAKFVLFQVSEPGKPFLEVVPR